MTHIWRKYEDGSQKTCNVDLILKVLGWSLVWGYLINLFWAGHPGAECHLGWKEPWRMLHWCQVRVLQGVMMSGVALWTTDIGGYSGGNPKDPLFQVETKIPTISDHFGEYLKRSTISCNFTKVSQKTHNLSLLFAGADSPLVPVWCFLSTFPSAWGEGRSGIKIIQNITTSVQGGLLLKSFHF